MSISSGQIVDPAGVQQCQDALGLTVAAGRFKALSLIDIAQWSVFTPSACLAMTTSQACRKSPVTGRR